MAIEQNDAAIGISGTGDEFQDLLNLKMKAVLSLRNVEI
jgi:hypothetical protein